MLIWVTLKVAVRSLWANRLRTVLATLGIIIGVSAVIFVLAIVSGAQQFVMGRIQALGTNLLLISPGQRGSGGVVSGTQENLKIGDAEELLKSIPAIRDVAPVVRGNVQVKHLDRNSRSTVMGTSVTYFPIRDFHIGEGKLFSDAQADAFERVAVIGPVTARNLFGTQDAIGQTIKLNGINFRIIGVLQAKGDQGFYNPDDQVFIPYTTAMKQILGLDYLQELDVRARDETQLGKIQTEASEILRRRHRLEADMPDDFNLFNQADLLKTFGNIAAVMGLMAGGIASISLLVGGIGIMNIMLMTVTERTREIGVRKAIGAKERDILTQFLIEAVFLSAIGGGIGIAMGIALSAAVSYFSSFTAVVSPFSVVLALGFSAAVGIFFGFYPARRAAKLDPIEALRYE